MALARAAVLLCLCSVFHGAIASTSALGDYISSWVKSQEGKLVGSDATDHQQTECWDLAMAAIEHARAKGFSIPRSPSTYEWSSETVSYKDAQPGDIVQFVSWEEKHRWTGRHHTAVVTAAWDSETCGLQTDGQNPDPVHQAVYHPCDRISGSLVVYRLGGSQPSPSPSPPPSPSPFTGKYQVGDHVEGLYKDGIWYAATIAKINSDGTYTLEWADGGTEDTIKAESQIRPATSPSPSPASKYQVGDHVEGLYKDGIWYAATIVKINSDGTYTLEWEDGGSQDTVKPESKIRPRNSKYQVGELVEGLYKDGYWYKATIVKGNTDGTYTLKWADGGTQDTVKPESKIRIPSGDADVASQVVVV